MWRFIGVIEFECDVCADKDSIPIENFEIECTGSSKRSMGKENIYEISFEFDCLKCSNPISLFFETSEYPADCLNFIANNSRGANTSSEPGIEYLEDIYEADDLYEFNESIQELIFALKTTPELVREISPREFEEVVTEIFRAKGFEVDLTQRTNDGGKDIIAIHTDALGIKNKYFIECKRYAEDKKVGVALVRALQGVKNTKDGPNKTILVTTSTFTSGAKKFAQHEASSKWDISLTDYDALVDWLNEY